MLVCKWHQSCFDLFTGGIKAWCPGLDPDGTSKIPLMKPMGNLGKNRTPLGVFPVRVSDGRIWAALE